MQTGEKKNDTHSLLYAVGQSETEEARSVCIELTNKGK